MHLVCPHCRQRLDFADARPKFCGYCGQVLGDAAPVATVADEVEAVTRPPDPLVEAETLPPTTPADSAADFPVTPAAGAGEYLSHTSAGTEDLPEAVGPYRLLRRLGGGGMGTVYEATDAISGRRVALKLVHPGYAASRDAIDRFRQEGELASKLAHPRCVFVLAAGADAGRPFIVMELMTGSTLDDLVKENGPLPPTQALRKILDVIDGLQEAHQLGLVHRDVKPSNCFLEADGRVKIGDFGLAKSLAQQAHLTRTGTFLGTPLYAAPEQIKMEKVDAQSDVYSVAATLYFLLTGRAPFQTGDSMATMARIVADDPPSMRTLQPKLPKALDKVVLRGLERDRKRRWRSLDEFHRALRPFLPAQPSVGGVGLRLVAYLLDALLLGAVGFGWGLLLAIGMALLTSSALLGPVPALLLTQVLGALPNLVYFGVLEGLWGQSLGKRVLRLRVGTIASGQPPGIGRTMLRAGILYLLFNLGNLVLLALLPLLVDMRPAPQQQTFHLEKATQEQIRQAGVIFLAAGSWFYIALALLVSTMRKRNGYRGLHEFLSGTRTYRLRRPQIKKRRVLTAPDFHLDLTQPAGLPEQVGPYRIRGALRWTPQEQTLLGDDVELGRAVWIWVRPETERPLSEAERIIDRTTRVRWVSCGALPGQQWEAFLAPAGCPLPALVAVGRRLTWGEFHGVLEDLTEELRVSCAEGSLPDALVANQVWVGRDGRMQLLGVPFGPAANPDQPITAGALIDRPADQPRGLRFIHEVSLVALTGRTPPAGLPPPRIEAPLPLYAARLLNRLLPQPARSATAVRGERAVKKQQADERYDRIEQFQADLLAAQTEPAEVTRQMRGKHLVWHALFAWLGLTICGLLAVVVMQSREESFGQEPGVVMGLLGLAVGVVSFFLPVCWLRGGLSFVMSGIAVVRADGRRASRLRCLWRALLAWTLFAVIVGLMVLVEAGIVMAATLISGLDLTASGFGTWPLIQIGVAVAFFAGFVMLLLRNPARAPHDFVAGTYLVPK